MTATSTALVSRKMASERSLEDQHRALDRILARRYVAYLIHQNQMALERQMRRGTLIYRPRLELCDDPSSSRIVATLEIPGMRANEVRLRLEGDKLFISGDRRPHHQESDVKYPAKEIKYGRFERVLEVSKGTLMSTISASMADGLLTVSWPRKPLGGAATTNNSHTSVNDSCISFKDEGTSDA